jgi:hypothetical protein
VRLSPRVALLGGAVLATTVLTGPIAAAQPLPHNVDGGLYAGYQATVTDAASVSASWTEPTVTCPRHNTSFITFGAGVSLRLAGAGTDEESAGVELSCTGLRPSLIECLITNVDSGLDPLAGVYSDPVSPGDALSASVTQDGQNYVLTIADATKGWSETRTVPTPAGVPDTVAGVRTDDEGPSGPGEVGFGAVAFTGATVNGQPLATADPIALDSTEPDGAVDRTGPLTSGDFTVTQTA